jgi:hypothetical protein
VQDLTLPLRFSRAFPAEDVPRAMFSGKYERNDITDDITAKFSGKKWTDVVLDDWIYCADVEVVSYYMAPEAFKYYIPSLLVSVIDKPDYLDWGVRGLLPHNKDRRPRVGGWESFRRLFSKEQECCVHGFLEAARSNPNASSEVRSLVEIALRGLW